MAKTRQLPVFKSDKAQGKKLTKRQKQQVKRLIGLRIERKFEDSSFLGSVDGAGNCIVMATPPQNATENGRIGNTITVKKLTVSMKFTGADDNNIVRFIIFRWSQNNNVTAPQVSDVLAQLNPMGLYNDESLNQGKIHIVHDQLFTFSLNGENNKATRKVIYGKQLGKKRISFNPGTLSTTGTDQFYVLLISDSVVSSHPAYVGHIRMEFTDA